MMEMIKILEANTDLLLLLFDALLSLHNVLPPVVVFFAVGLLVLHDKAVAGILSFILIVVVFFFNFCFYYKNYSLSKCLL
jgi:hypothetical protein